MMRIDSIGRSAAFAAAIALGWIAWLVVTAPVLGVGAARALYLVAATALYTGALAATPPRRASTTAIVGAIGLVLATVAGGGPELVLGLAIVLGTARGTFLHRASPARHTRHMERTGRKTQTFPSGRRNAGTSKRRTSSSALQPDTSRTHRGGCHASAIPGRSLLQRRRRSAAR